MYQTEKIAILLATYNGKNYIAGQMDSILKQTYTEWMLYIHDDGSTDGTVELLEQYANKYEDKICIIKGEPTGGAKENFFYLFQQVEAPYYMCCDQDDIWLPNKIAVTYEKMQAIAEKNKPSLVFTDLKVVDGDLNVLAEKMSVYQGLDCKTLTFNRAMIQNVVTGCTMMVNHKLRDELLKVDAYENVLMHDWWVLLVAARFGKLAFVEDSTILYRQHGNNGVGAQNARSFFYKLKRMLQGSDIKQSLENTRKQAFYFAKVYGQSAGNLAAEYGELGSNGKLKRIAFYIKNDVKKSTFSKNVGLMIWG